MLGITKVVLLGACVVTLLCCEATQAEDGKALIQPVVAPVPHSTKIIAPISLAGKQIILHFQLAEISLSKMQRLDVDLARHDEQKIQKLIGSDWMNGTVLPAGLLDALRKNKIARILAAPRIAAYDNHLAIFQAGSNLPLSTEKNDGQPTTDFVFAGTQLEVVPKMVDDQNVLLQIKLDWSELGESPADHAGAPRVRHIKIDTAIEAKLGEVTLLSRSPRIVRRGEQDEEFTLILTVTPELAKRQKIGKRAFKRIGQAVSRDPTGERLR